MIGKFIAKAKEVGISKTTAGLPQVVVNFGCYPGEEDIKNGAKPFEKTWFGSLKGDASPITLQTLAILGYKFTVNDLSDIANGQGLDFNKEVEVVIDENEYNGKKSERIKGVFEVGSAGFSKMNPQEAVTLLKGLDISGTVMNFMQTKGIVAGGAKTTPVTPGPAAGEPGGKPAPF
jgi:hypothetical protein